MVASPGRLLLAAVLAAVLAGTAIGFYMFEHRGGGGGSAVSVPLPGWLGSAPRVIEVSSPDFSMGGRIPERFTCDGEDVSPEILIGNVPPEAKSIALIMYDPDAPAGWFTHWVLYDVPPTVARIPRAVPPRPVVEGLGLQGVNDFGRIGYGGPCPPRGHGVHRYIFLVVALDVPRTGLPPGASLGQLVERIQGHIVGYGYTYGTYSR